MRDLYFEASKQEISLTPQVPLRAAFQNASIPFPMGETTPRPVITTFFDMDGYAQLKATPTHFFSRRGLKGN